MRKYFFLCIGLLSLSQQTEASRVIVDPRNLEEGMNVNVNGVIHSGAEKNEISLTVGAPAAIDLRNKDGSVCLGTSISNVPSKKGYKLIGRGDCRIEELDLMYE